jgi:hypothetical protein
MIIWMVRERVRLRHSVNRRLLALGEAHPRGGASWLAEVGSAKRDLGLWPSGDLCGEPVIRSWRNVCRRPQAVGQFRASRQDSARTLVHARCEWLLTRPVARSAAWASSTSSSRPKPPKIGFEHRIGRPRSLMGRSSVAPQKRGLRRQSRHLTCIGERRASRLLPIHAAGCSNNLW